MESRRPIGDVLGTGTLTGAIAGLAAGAIDAIWSWSPASQFLPHFATRLRFVTYTALSHALLGLVLGFAATFALVILSRATRLGDALRFLFAHRKPTSTVGLSLAIAGVPVLAAFLLIAYRTTMPFVANRHEMRLVVLVAMASVLAALVLAAPVAFVAARPIEALLSRLTPRVSSLASVWAPFVAIALFISIGLGLWAVSQWQTAKILPLRGPLISIVGCALAIIAWRPAAYANAKIRALPLVARIGVWIAKPVILFVLVLVAGGSAAVIKAETAYTGMGGGIAHVIRDRFDRDGDGYSRVLGGGDCDDRDASVHPGAFEIPDDGIDQNCLGGDATANAKREDPAFVPLPDTVPKDFNILVVTIDTTRADHLGMYGYTRPTSPNLDAVAAQGTLFVNGWAHAPSTRYSMPAILTGRLPLDVHFDSNWWPGLATQATTIAQYLQPLGFVTGAITNYEYFDRSRHFDKGFTEYDNEDARLHSAVPGKGPEATHGTSSKQQSDKAISFVDRHASDRWMLWVHYYDPHADYEPHPEVKSFGGDAEALYDGEIEFTDQQLGRLFQELKAKGLYDKTVIVVTGDHGEGFGEHGVYFHGYHLYSAQTKVPFVIRVPGLAPRKATTPAGHDDIIPTLVNLAGGTYNSELMGRSLVDAIAGKDTARTVFQQLSFENNNEKRGAADGECHVIYNVSPDPSWEVYRTDRDPGEAHDLSYDDDECKATRDAFVHWYDNTRVLPNAKAALLAAKPAIAHPVDVTYGSDIQLDSVDVPAKVKPGDISLVWTFDAKGTPPPGNKLFVHIESPGAAMQNGDHTPDRPFEYWKSGQTIRYTTTIHVTRPGVYTVWAGVFKDATRMHATTTTATKIRNGDEAAVATFEVAL